jgi:flagellar biosynthetic protein FliR
MESHPFHELLLAQAGLAYLLTAVRLGTFAACCPRWLTALLPPRTHAALVVVFSILLTPLWIHRVTARISPVELPALVAQEVIVGIAMGFAVSSIVLAMQMAGSTVDRLLGMGLNADAITGHDEPLVGLSVWFRLLCVAILVTAGGHRQIVQACSETFVQIPPGSAWNLASPASMLAELMTHCFLFALRSAAPLVLAVMAAAASGAMLVRLVRTFASALSEQNLGLVVLLIVLFLSLPLYESLVNDHVATVIEMPESIQFGDCDP